MINQNTLDHLTDSFQNTIHQYWPDGITGYSFKTNNLPWIINYMKCKGLYAEVVSSDEFRLAEKLKFPYNRIIFNGPVKGEDEFLTALEQGSIVNLDSKRELEWLLKCPGIAGKVGLRVNFDLESMCPNETQCGHEDGRFGFSYETGELADAIRFLQNNRIPLSGLHLHCSSKTRSTGIYEAIAKTAAAIVNKFNLSLEYIDIGGGFFGGVPGKPDFKAYFECVDEVFSKNPLLKNVNLITEPGMCLVGASIDYVTSVIDVKDTLHNRFVILDGSRIHIDPLMRKTGYLWYRRAYGQTERPVRSDKQTLCGFTCMENDRFFQLSSEDAFDVGDQVVFQKVGAYTMGLSPLFIQWFPAVYVKTPDKISCVRQKWSEKQLFLTDTEIP